MSHCPTCGATYEGSVLVCPKDGALLVPAPAPDPLVGSALDDKYRLDARLNQGGMGTIYRATHLMLNRTVAVKLIRPDLVTSQDVVQRFMREARTAGTLDHPNIAQVYDLEQTADGRLYIAMEFVRGESLKDVIRAQGALPPDRVVRILTQVASALAVAHQHGCIHRDLKPQNIMLAPGDVAKLVDFGIAKVLDDAGTQITSTGFAIGTPQYMSPEQAAGKPVDARSDLYSLGVVLYEMLVGDVPFNDPSTPAVLVKHLTEAPPRFAARFPDRRVPDALEALAMRCLEKDPAARFESAEAFAAALAAAWPAAAPAGGQAFAAAPAVAAAASGGQDLLPTVPVPSAPGGPSASGAVTQADVTMLLSPGGVAPDLPATVAPPAAPTAKAAPAPGAVSPAVGTTMPPPASVTPARHSPAAGGVMVATVLIVLAIGAVGFTGYRLGYWDRDDAVAPAAEPVAPVVPPPPGPDPATTPAAAPQTDPGAPPPAAAAGDTPAQIGGTAATTPGGTGSPPPASPPVPTIAGAAGATRSPTTGSPSAARPPAGSGGTAAASTSSPRTPGVGRSASEPPVVPAPAATTPVRQTPSPAAPAPPAVPEHPAVLVRCGGVADVCAVVRSTVVDSLGRASMGAAAGEAGADVTVVMEATEGPRRVESMFGTTVVIRTFTVTVAGASARFRESVPMPPPATFSYDDRVGRARLEDQARLIATAVTSRVQAYWRTKAGG